MGRISHLAVGLATFAVTAAPAMPAPRSPVMSVMTYNVHGLPWPIAEDRAASLSAIATQLRAMRAAGHQPDIVALQEAFVPDAKAIGLAAGYRYIAFGAPAEDSASATTPDDRRFVAVGSMLRGERAGKHVGSGLAIFSEYPIVGVRRMSYPICAGYDCLANKGVLAASIAVPGIVGPVTFIDTHLNSNGAAGVLEPRALYAYERQIDLLNGFIESVARSDGTILVAGDFNVGRDVARRSYFAQRMFRGPIALTFGTRQCQKTPLCQVKQPADVAQSTGRAKDWLMYRSSNAVSIRPICLSAPFGHNSASAMLSDHVGIMITFVLGDGNNRTKQPLVLARR